MGVKIFHNFSQKGQGPNETIMAPQVHNLGLRVRVDNCGKNISIGVCNIVR